MYLNSVSALTRHRWERAGLIMVKGHVEALNGIVDIRSQLGEGTKFTITLPLNLNVDIAENTASNTYIL